MDLTTPSELQQSLTSLPASARALLDRLLAGRGPWNPLAGPQLEAYLSPADITLYGGSAGGGKTDLLLGLANTAHQNSIIFRREFPQLRGIIERQTTILGSRDGFNENTKVWRLPEGRVLEFGAVQRVGDEQKYQGRPHDLKGFDEITHFTEKQFRFLIAWNRTADANQRTRVVCTGNPPTDSDGEWVIDFWAPWLDEDHPNPARPGELRWFITILEDGRQVDREVPGPEAVEVNGETLYPQSRTFIPARLQDNPFLMASGYERTLQNLPVELRERLLKGLFIRASQDSPWQIIPSDWIDRAVERWKAIERPEVPITQAGVDVARGGDDQTIIANRYGDWIDNLVVFPGIATPDGPTAATAVIGAIGNDDPVVAVDVIGYGSSCYDSLKANGVKAVPLNASEGTKAKDQHGKFGFANKRAEWYWRLREALNPENNPTLALPPDRELKRDLCAVRWKLTSRGIQVESKQDIIDRIQRSPDRADAVAYALAASTQEEFYYA